MAKKENYNFFCKAGTPNAGVLFETKENITEEEAKEYAEKYCLTYKKQTAMERRIAAFERN